MAAPAAMAWGGEVMTDEHPSLSLVRQLEARHKWELDTLCAEIEQLKAALQPFALNVNAVSLRDALGHITREDLLRARAALEPKP